VITAHEASREDALRDDPAVITGSTNRNLLQPTDINKKRRQSRIKEIQDSIDKGKHRSSSSSGDASGDASRSKSRVPLLGKLLSRQSSSSSSKSDRSQLVDLVVEDHKAEEIERVRARKEGGAAWNEAEQKHYV